ncbi:MAG TPA: hypothetical protein VEI97_12115 [bacterium]|nr:hypothetical protein [bacterium]
MRYCSLALLAALAAAVGCGRPDSAPTAAAAPKNVPPAAVPAGGLVESTVGLFTVTVDTAGLTARVTPAPVRGPQATDDVYHLSIDNFTRPGTLAIESVRRTATDLELRYRVTHPFAAPVNLDAAATASNRADLGIGGRVAVLLDVPAAAGNTYTFSDGAVIANTGTVSNADGYYRPLGLLPLDPSRTADTFPYKLLVDELADPRLDPNSGTPISNGGSVVGNYDAGIGGWQRPNMGADRNAWTGYGFLHQGQAATNLLALDLDAVTGQNLTFDTAILAKYIDPRGGANAREKRANRLPKNPPDINAFVYRMPHGALDVERIDHLGTTGSIIVNQVSAAQVALRVTDWDARAVETTEADLALDPLITNVAAGESGLPVIEISVPPVTGTTPVVLDNGTDVRDDDTAWGGDPAVDSGIPGDGIVWEGTVTNTALSGQAPGATPGLIRALDAEETNPTAHASWRFFLDPSLTPLTANAPRNDSFQAFTLDLAGPSTQPTATFTMLTPTVGSGGMAVVQASGYSDVEGDQIEVRIDWNNDGDFSDTGESGNTLPGAGGPPVNFPSPITYTYSGSSPDTRTLPIQYTDNISAPKTVTPALTFNVVAATAGCTVPPPPKVDPNLPGTFDFPSRTNTTWTALGFPSQQGFIDVAAFTTPARTGWIVMLHSTSAGIFDFYHIAGPTPAEVTRMTNFGTLLQSRQCHQIEVDSTGRVFFANKQGTTSTVGSPSSTYTEISGNAQPGIRWFDYSGSLVTAIGGSISTTGVVIALAIDRNDNLLMIDNSHVLHRYLKATGYTEDFAAPFPLNLAPTIGLPTGTGDAARNVHDFVVNFHNNAMYILVQSEASPANSPPGNGYLYRVECNGAINPTTPMGNLNPLRFIVNSTSISGQASDITIDNHNAAGGILPTASDVQMVITGYTGSGNLNPDLQHVNSELQLTGGVDVGSSTYSPQDGSIDPINNRLLSTVWLSSGNVMFFNTPPAGWQ